MKFDLIECGYEYESRHEFASIEDAAREAEDGVDAANYDGDRDRTIWIDWCVRLSACDDCEGECDESANCGACHPMERGGTVQIDPVEPDCTESEHSWEDGQPHGHGGGVIYVDTCRYCGLKRQTDTWAHRSDTGEEGLTEVQYNRERETFVEDCY